MHLPLSTLALHLAFLLAWSRRPASMKEESLMQDVGNYDGLSRNDLNVGPPPPLHATLLDDSLFKETVSVFENAFYF